MCLERHLVRDHAPAHGLCVANGEMRDDHVTNRLDGTSTIVGQLCQVLLYGGSLGTHVVKLPGRRVSPGAIPVTRPALQDR